jgi:hypothetical protein
MYMFFEKINKYVHMVFLIVMSEIIIAVYKR